MANFLGKIFGKQEKAKQEHSYVLVDPRNVKINYRYSSLFPTTNVAIENGSSSLFGSLDTISLPTKPFMQYVYDLQNCSDRTIQNPLYRTVQVIPFNNKKIFVFPNVKSIQNPIVVYNDETFTYPLNAEQKTLTPELEKILSETVKAYTR